MERFHILLVTIIASLWLGESFAEFFLLGWFLLVALVGTALIVFLFMYKGLFNVPQRDINYAALYGPLSLLLLLALLASLLHFDWVVTGSLLVVSFALFFARSPQC